MECALYHHLCFLCFPGASVVKNLPANAGDTGSIPGLGRLPAEGKSKGEQDGGGVGRHGVFLSPQRHQEYTFRDKRSCRTPAESRKEYLTTGKECTEHAKFSRMKEAGGEEGASRTGSAPEGWRTETGVRSPHWGNCPGQRKRI